MLGQYLITFREALEAALITSIILAYFIRTKQGHLTKYVWLGVFIAIGVSVIIAAIVGLFYGGLSSADAKLFEGIAALIAVAVLTSMIIWMALKGKNIDKQLNEGVKKAVERGTMFSLVAFSFIVIFREGFETVLFLIPFGTADVGGTIAGAIIGILSALAISYLIFRIGIKINLSRFFYFTSILLVLLAAGLFGYGIHELISYQSAIGVESGWFSTYAFDLGLNSESIWHHKGVVGSVFAVLLGYSVKMEWARLIGHAAYLLIFLPMTILAYKNPQSLDWLNRAISKFYSLIRKPSPDFESSEGAP